MLQKYLHRESSTSTYHQSNFLYFCTLRQTKWGRGKRGEDKEGKSGIERDEGGEEW